MVKKASASKIHVGNCIELMGQWSPSTVDLVFADPPYNIGFQYEIDERGLNGKGIPQFVDRRSYDEYVAWTQDWISQCARLLKPTGSLFVLIGDEYAAETRMHLKTLESEGKLSFRNWIIWHYTFGQNCKAKFNRSHAHLFYCVGSAALDRWPANDPPFVFNRDDIAVPSARQTTYRDSRANPKGKLPDDTWYLRPQQPEIEGDPMYFRPDEDTWYLSRVCGTFKERLGWHPCQLPEAMLERIVKLASNEGDVVFDPFVGSGTTLAVAARLGRRWLGCELSKDYAKKATARIRHVAKTGSSVETTFADKGIVKGKPRKKAEPVRSPHLKRRRSKSA